jgi:hypothetical protein
MTLAPTSSQHIPSTYIATPVTAYTAALLPFTGFHSQSLRDLASPNFDLDFNASSATSLAHSAPQSLFSTPIALPDAPAAKSPTTFLSQTTVINFQPLAQLNVNFDEFSILLTIPSAPPSLVGPPITFHDTPAAKSLAISPQQTIFTEYQSPVHSVVNIKIFIFFCSTFYIVYINNTWDMHFAVVRGTGV